MQGISEILHNTLQQLGLKKRYHAELIMERWSEIVGDDISQHSCPVKFERGLMFVTVSNSVWCHHLFMLKESIISKLNRFIGEKIVKDIRFQAGYLKDCKNQENTEHSVSLKQSLAAIRLDEQELAGIRQYTHEVADEALQKKLAGFTRKALAYNKLKKLDKWHACQGCNALCPPEETYCAVCLRTVREEKLGEIRKLLLDAPWFSHEDLQPYLSCTRSEFDRAKSELLARLCLEYTARNGQVDSVHRTTIVMLMKSVGPDEITPETVDHTLEKFRRKQHVFAPRS